MPELPEVETVMRGLEKVLLGRRITGVRLARPDLRLPFPQGFAKRLEGRKVERFERRAKYILAHLDNGEALLVQSVIAGLGNIYVCEALPRAGLSPRRKAGSLVKKNGYDRRLDALVSHIRAVLSEAIEAGGSTLRDHARPDGELGIFQHRFAVYDREGEPCPRPGCG